MGPDCRKEVTSVQPGRLYSVCYLMQMAELQEKLIFKAVGGDLSIVASASKRGVVSRTSDSLA